MFAIHLYEWIILLHLEYVIKISIMHVMQWGKHCEIWKRLLCYPENDDENFSNFTLTRAANIRNVGTWIMKMLLYQNHMETSSIIHMYHYSLITVHKLLIDLTKHSKTKQNKTKQKTKHQFTTCNQMYVSAYVCLYVHMYVYVCVRLQLLTYSVEHSPSSEANQFPTSQEIPCILWNPKLQCCIYERLPPVPFLSQINPVHAPHPTSWRSILIFSSHLHLGLPSGSLSLRFPHKTLCGPLLFPPTCYMPNPSHSQFDHLNNIWWGIQIIKLLIVFSSLPCYLVPLRPKYSPQHNILNYEHIFLVGKYTTSNIMYVNGIQLYKTVDILSLFAFAPVFLWPENFSDFHLSTSTHQCNHR
jgi:hypothetical protein